MPMSPQFQQMPKPNNKFLKLLADLVMPSNPVEGALDLAGPMMAAERVASKTGQKAARAIGRLFTGETVETGKPIKFLYSRNTMGAPKLANGIDTYQQTIEPAGKYLNEVGESQAKYLKEMGGQEVGTQSFDNPLVVEFHPEKKDWKYDDKSWKKKLSDEFGATGKALTKKIVKSGHDGIITVWPDGSLGEIVDLRVVKF